MGPFIFRKICTSYSESGERNDALSTDQYESTLLTFQFYISKEETNMKNKTLKFEVPEEIKEKLREVVKKQEEIEEMDGKIKVKKKRNWKKIAAYTAAGLAVVGAGIAIAVKLKNGEDPTDAVSDYDYILKELSDGSLAEIRMHDGGIIGVTLENQSADSFAGSFKELLGFARVVDPYFSEVHFTADLCDFSFIHEGQIAEGV